jgi:PilZ domain
MSTPSAQQITTQYETPRRWQRFKLNVPIRVGVNRQDKTTIVSGRGNEVSEGGLAIFAGLELRIGEEIWVEFTPPYSSQPLRVNGITRNRSGYKYGIEFLTNTPAEEERVERLRELLRFASGNQPI